MILFNMKLLKMEKKWNKKLNKKFINIVNNLKESIVY